MENQPVTTPVATKQPTKKPLLLICLLVVILLGAAAYYVTHNKSVAKTSDSSLPSDWTEYKADKYGFQFNYLKGWGNPKISSIKFARGTKYNVFILDSSKTPSRNVKITIDTNDLEQKVCETESRCTSIPPLTSSTIKKVLTQKNTSFLTKGNDYYANLDSTPAGNSVLNYYRIVDLKKLNGSAIEVTYSKLKTTGCNDNQLGTNDKCINSGEFDQIKKLANSIEPI